MRFVGSVLIIIALANSSEADLGDSDRVEPSALTTFVEGCIETRARQATAAGLEVSTAQLLPSCGCVGDWIATLKRKEQKDLKESFATGKGPMFDRMLKAAKVCGDWEQASDRTKSVYVKTPYSGRKRTAAATWLKFLDCEQRMTHVEAKDGERMRYCDRLLKE